MDQPTPPSATRRNGQSTRRGYGSKNIIEAKIQAEPNYLPGRMSTFGRLSTPTLLRARQGCIRHRWRIVPDDIMQILAAAAFISENKGRCCGGDGDRENDRQKPLTDVVGLVVNTLLVSSLVSITVEMGITIKIDNASLKDPSLLEWEAKLLFNIMQLPSGHC